MWKGWRWRALLLAAIPAATLGCNSVNLVFAPYDLVASAFHGWNAVTRAPSPGPIEARLLEAAEREDRLPLVADTEEPAHDAKLRARACDRGEDAACGGVGALFFYFLREPELGIELLERACQAGDTEACLRASEALAIDRPERDWTRHLAFARRACLGEPAFGRACYDEVRSAKRFLPRDANEGLEVVEVAPGVREVVLIASSSGRGEPPLTLFAARRMHRACELGEAMACRELEDAFRKGARGLPEDPALADYMRARQWMAEGAVPGLDGDRLAADRGAELVRARPHVQEWLAPGGDEVERRIFEALAPRQLTRRLRAVFHPNEWAYVVHPWVERSYQRAHPLPPEVQAQRDALGNERVAAMCRARVRSALSSYSGRPLFPDIPPDFWMSGCNDSPLSGWRFFETAEDPPASCVPCLLECDALEPEPTPEQDGCLCRCAAREGGCGIVPWALAACLEAHAPEAVP